MGRKKIDCFIDFEHYNQFLRFIDLLLHISPQWLLDISFIGHVFTATLLITLNTQDNMGGPQVKMPVAIPLTQFKVKSTMI